MDNIFRLDPAGNLVVRGPDKLGSCGRAASIAKETLDLAVRYRGEELDAIGGCVDASHIQRKLAGRGIDLSEDDLDLVMESSARTLTDRLNDGSLTIDRSGGVVMTESAGGSAMFDELSVGGEISERSLPAIDRAGELTKLAAAMSRVVLGRSDRELTVFRNQLRTGVDRLSGHIDREPPESYSEHMSLWVKDELDIALSFLDNAILNLDMNGVGSLVPESIAEKAWELAGLKLPIAPESSRIALIESAYCLIQTARLDGSIPLDPVNPKDYLGNEGGNHE